MPVRLLIDGAVRTLLLDAPPLNVLDLELLAELNLLLDQLTHDREARLVIFAAKGDRAFSAGVSVEEHAPDRIPEMLERVHGAFHRLRALPFPSLAAVHATCLGGGLELVLACDLLLVANEAHLAFPEIELGCFPPIAAALLPQRLGQARAFEVLATSRRFSGREAVQWGLANWAVPQGTFAAELAVRTADLLGRSGVVLSILKRALEAGQTLPFKPALVASEDLYRRELSATADMREGLAAFLEKRKPVWQHR